MKKDNIDQLFHRIQGDVDIASPSADHKASFLVKLQEQQATSPLTNTKIRRVNWWKPIAVAASVLLVVGFLFTNNTGSEVTDLADISPELEQAQEFFTRTIERELFEINKQTSPETQELVDDTQARMLILEKEYDKLKTDLSESGQDKRVIYAMIDNFQNRIDLLQQVLEHMDAIKNLNQLKPSTL